MLWRNCGEGGAGATSAGSLETVSPQAPDCRQDGDRLDLDLRHNLTGMRKAESLRGQIQGKLPVNLCCFIKQYPLPIGAGGKRPLPGERQ